MKEAITKKYLLIALIFSIVISIKSYIDSAKPNQYYINNAILEFKKIEGELKSFSKWLDSNGFEGEYRVIQNNLKTGYTIDIDEQVPDTFSNFIKKLKKKTKYLVMYIYPDIVRFHTKIKAKRYLYSFIYFRTSESERFKNEKIYFNNNIPQENSGWLYQIEGDWYLYSGFTAEKTIISEIMGFVRFYLWTLLFSYPFYFVFKKVYLFFKD